MRKLTSGLCFVVLFVALFTPIAMADTIDTFGNATVGEYGWLYKEGNNDFDVDLWAEVLTNPDGDKLTLGFYKYIPPPLSPLPWDSHLFSYIDSRDSLGYGLYLRDFSTDWTRGTGMLHVNNDGTLATKMGTNYVTNPSATTNVGIENEDDDDRDIPTPLVTTLPLDPPSTTASWISQPDGECTSYGANNITIQATDFNFLRNANHTGGKSGEDAYVCIRIYNTGTGNWDVQGSTSDWLGLEGKTAKGSNPYLDSTGDVLECTFANTTTYVTTQSGGAKRVQIDVAIIWYNDVTEAWEAIADSLTEIVTVYP